MKILVAAVMALLILAVGSSDGLASDDSNKKHNDKNKPHTGEIVAQIKNTAYLKECGACHFAYHPELLPKRSWEKLMSGLDNHFGDNAALEEPARTELLNYLLNNAAESSSVKVSKKIIASIKANETPIRISDTGYFKKEHRKIKPEVLKRKSIGSLSNCVACHTTADTGDYEEERVKIPRN
jgi:nitrate/TMAO reductase-like tetraheme cytochrome c subunit